LIVAQTRYVIPYCVRSGAVEILRVFHASRRPPKRW
jgi:plasmid stabilization system protein ParE